MKVAIFGATGIAGRAVVEEALKKGYEVTVLTRNASHVHVNNPKLNVIVGNITDRATIARVLHGQDAVIQTLGIGGKGDGKPTTFVSEMNNHIMDEMKNSGIKRLIAISVIGAGESWNFLPWIYRKMVLPIFQKWFVPIIADKNRMETTIEKSGLEWTVIRSTTLTAKSSKGTCVVSLNGKGIRKFSIPAADVAKFMVEQLTETKYIHKCPTITGI